MLKMFMCFFCPLTVGMLQNPHCNLFLGQLGSHQLHFFMVPMWKIGDMVSLEEVREGESERGSTPSLETRTKSPDQKTLELRPFQTPYLRIPYENAREQTIALGLRDL